MAKSWIVRLRSCQASLLNTSQSHARSASLTHCVFSQTLLEPRISASIDCLSSSPPEHSRHECESRWLPTISRDRRLTRLIAVGMGIRQAHHPRGASAQEPAHAGQGHPRTRSDSCQAREAGEDAHPADQDERQEWTDGCLQDPGQGSCPDETIH